MKKIREKGLLKKLHFFFLSYTLHNNFELYTDNVIFAGGRVVERGNLRNEKRPFLKFSLFSGADYKLSSKKPLQIKVRISKNFNSFLFPESAKDDDRAFISMKFLNKSDRNELLYLMTDSGVYQVKTRKEEEKEKKSTEHKNTTTTNNNNQEKEKEEEKEEEETTTTTTTTRKKKRSKSLLTGDKIKTSSSKKQKLSEQQIYELKEFDIRKWTLQDVLSWSKEILIIKFLSDIHKKPPSDDNDDDDADDDDDDYDDDDDDDDESKVTYKTLFELSEEYFKKNEFDGKKLIETFGGDDDNNNNNDNNEQPPNFHLEKFENLKKFMDSFSDHIRLVERWRLIREIYFMLIGGQKHSKLILNNFVRVKNQFNFIAQQEQQQEQQVKKKKNSNNVPIIYDRSEMNLILLQRKVLKVFLKQKKRALAATQSTTTTTTTKTQKLRLYDILKLRKRFHSRKIIEDMLLSLMYTDIKDENEVSKKKTFSVKFNIFERKSAAAAVNKNNKNNSKNRKKKAKKKKKKKKSKKKKAFYRTCLSIGNLQIEWDDTSLVKIQPTSSKTCILCLDVGVLRVENGYELVKKISKEIQKWNTHTLYDPIIKNCENFAQTMLQDVLGLDWEASVEVRRFLEGIRSSKNCEKCFKFDKKFYEVFFKNVSSAGKNSSGKNLYSSSPTILKEKKIGFGRHEELDYFVQYLFHICPNFERDYNKEYILLKGFDRAFWLQLRSEQGNEAKRRRRRAVKEKEEEEIEGEDDDDDDDDSDMSMESYKKRIERIKRERGIDRRLSKFFTYSSIDNNNNQQQKLKTHRQQQIGLGAAKQQQQHLQEDKKYVYRPAKRDMSIESLVKLEYTRNGCPFTKYSEEVIKKVVDHFSSKGGSYH